MRKSLSDRLTDYLTDASMTEIIAWTIFISTICTIIIVRYGT